VADPKPLAKSLHTVTVLVRISETYMENEGYPPKDALSRTLQDLGYANAPDPYNLAGAALKQLEA
jgi:hypothetical protein